MLIVESERLCLRQYTIEDSDFIIKLLNQPSFLENIGDKSVKTTVEAEKYLQKNILKSYHKNGFGLSMVELKDTRTPIGMCGILKRETLKHPDLGYAFLAEYCGKGYASEIAKQLIQSATHLYGLKTILAITSPNNKSSIRLLEKIGFKFERMEEAIEGQPRNKLFKIDL